MPTHPFRYIGQLWKFIQLHRAALSAQPTAIVGDLNSNVCWDKRLGGTIAMWSEGGGSWPGERLSPLSGISPRLGDRADVLLQRNLRKPYHIDYAFAPVPWLTSSSAWIGEPEQWVST